MIGIIPAAGKATRIHGLPKFLLPVPGGYLLERMANRMGVPCVIGAHPDNAALLAACKRPEDTVYQVASLTMCETILAARPYVGDEPVVMGMPDTYWTDETVFQRLTEYLSMYAVQAVCAVAAFHTSAEMASRLGVCTPGVKGLLRSIEDKQPQTGSRWVWGAMAWRADFWQYIDAEDVNPSFSMQRALSQGVQIPLYLASGQYYDNGTPESYFRCIRELTQTEAAT